MFYMIFCGCHITAIIRASQARDAGPTPVNRLTKPHHQLEREEIPKVIYKNNIESKNKFIKKYYMTMGIPILIALPIYFLMANYIFDSKEYSDVKWILYFSFSVTAIIAILVLLIVGKMHKRNYEQYVLEISETEIIEKTKRFTKTLKINELAKIDFSKKDRITVFDIKGNYIIINEFINDFSEIKELLKSKPIKQENIDSLRKHKLTNLIKRPDLIIAMIILLSLVVKLIKFLIT